MLCPHSQYVLFTSEIFHKQRKQREEDVTKSIINTGSRGFTKPSIICVDGGITNFNYFSSESKAHDNTWIIKLPRSRCNTKQLWCVVVTKHHWVCIGVVHVQLHPETVEIPGVYTVELEGLHSLINFNIFF
jgi:hypothetical protein